MEGNVTGKAVELLSLRKFYQNVSSHLERQWEFVHHDAYKVSILPTRIPGLLFRGQNTHYSPCRSALARGFEAGIGDLSTLSVSDQAKLTDRVARRVWFLQELRHHPASRWLIRNSLIGFDMALAQHYGIPTGYIDLSESFDVSCFFATCKFDRKTNKWEPCSGGRGVIYALPIQNIPIHPGALQPIGLQILPRPREQWGWVVVTGLNDNFEDIPGLTVFDFEHDEAVGRYFFDKFHEGADLFPHDPMAMIADQILESTVLPKDILTRVLDDLLSNGCAGPREEVVWVLTGQLGITLGEVPPLWKAEELERLNEKWTGENRSFFEGVGFRLVLEREPQSLDKSVNAGSSEV